MSSFFASLLLLFLCSPAPSVFAQAGPARCLECHSSKINAREYQKSAHSEVSCTACHVTDAGKEKPARCDGTFTKTRCDSCHETAAREHASSIHHSERLPIRCEQCHAGIHSLRTLKADKLAIAESCSRCHSRQHGYFDSDHFRALKRGNPDAATCTDCHGLHAIAKTDPGKGGRELHTTACLKCHDDAKLMTKNEVLPVAKETFFASYHGKNVRLGYPERVAGCADCHGAHSILNARDAGSKIHPDNLVRTCAQCHAQATPSFTRFIAHAETEGPRRTPALTWTLRAMTALLALTFVFFWTHSLLWAVRSFIERRRRARAESFAASHVSRALPDGMKLYRRFNRLHIALHLMVVVSFLGLALTGLPLKFSATGWGKALMDFFGGTARAGLIHRACAILTFAYFLIAIGLSIRFLFLDRKQPGTFLQKLLGPDSLFPNGRDLRDLKAMFRWFLFRGPRPDFERWAYWEKFDFLAVFWGMFAIGASGLLLWFPVFFGRLLPGWVFNLATIIHSDEALLATGFIFTVHFFNTHLRPEKFPMDFVIFNGEITKAELLEERGDQWRRYEREGRTEEFAVARPSSILWDAALRIFGFAAVLVGFALTAAMIHALASNAGGH
ncbi:MAG: cytochrome C [Oligoflexia bacterium]|nr:cytochrome C [Oligoflexia bacterium]